MRWREETLQRDPGVTPDGEGWEVAGVSSRPGLHGQVPVVIWKRRVYIEEKPRESSPFSLLFPFRMNQAMLDREKKRSDKKTDDGESE